MDDGNGPPNRLLVTHIIEILPDGETLSKKCETIILEPHQTLRVSIHSRALGALISRTLSQNGTEKNPRRCKTVLEPNTRHSVTSRSISWMLRVLQYGADSNTIRNSWSNEVRLRELYSLACTIWEYGCDVEEFRRLAEDVRQRCLHFDINRPLIGSPTQQQQTYCWRDFVGWNNICDWAVVALVFGWEDLFEELARAFAYSSYETVVACPVTFFQELEAMRLAKSQSTYTRTRTSIYRLFESHPNQAHAILRKLKSHANINLHEEFSNQLPEIRRLHAFDLLRRCEDALFDTGSVSGRSLVSSNSSGASRQSVSFSPTSSGSGFESSGASLQRISTLATSSSNVTTRPGYGQSPEPKKQGQRKGGPKKPPGPSMGVLTNGWKRGFTKMTKVFKPPDTTPDMVEDLLNEVDDFVRREQVDFLEGLRGMVEDWERDSEELRKEEEPRTKERERERDTKVLLPTVVERPIEERVQERGGSPEEWVECEG